MRIWGCVSVCGDVSLLLFSQLRWNREPILRASTLEGSIIEDERGRARIILGAPLPAVAERKRQGPLTNSMIFLDVLGFDQLTHRSSGNFG
jgi:hypothetical protein